METYSVYRDIQARTGGEIYMGVVGPVRTGKSTFIKRFMELMVLPGMEDEHKRTQARDELPQSAGGKTIMTTEPKFIPKEAAPIRLEEGVEAKVRLIDCVGFMVDGAVGHVENDSERLVKTPWYDYQIPFTKAAEIGTRKVITDHSTIGLVVTTDGTVGDIRREAYIPAEEKTVEELNSLGKPFLILLNSAKPYSDDTERLAGEMEEKYGVSVLPVNCEQLRKEDVMKILRMVLLEFPVTQMNFRIPRWMEILPADHWLKAGVIRQVKELMEKVRQMKDVAAPLSEISGDSVREMKAARMNLSDGTVDVDVDVDDGYYYQILSDYAGIPIEGEYSLMQTLGTLSQMKKEYEKVKNAITQVRMRGFGFVTPERSEIMLDEPQIVRHGNRYGVKMRAEAPSISMIKAHIETEIAPIVGSEQQAEDLIAYIRQSGASGEDGIWNTNIFGKSIEQIVDDGIQAKVSQLTEECQMKLQDTLQKIINDSNGGMICIII